MTALRELATLEATSGLTDNDMAAAKYRFIVAIEVCIDLGQHIISDDGLRVAEDSGDVFASLSEAGILDSGFVASLRAMTGFRNLLVHGYARIDDGRVRETLRTRLGDFGRFRAAIAVYSGE